MSGFPFGRDVESGRGARPRAGSSLAQPERPRAGSVASFSLLLVAMLTVLTAVPASAQPSIACGQSVVGSLGDGVDVYSMTAVPGATGFVQGSITSGDISGLRIKITGPGVAVDSCRNSLTFQPSGAGVLRIEVSSCLGGGGDYVLSAHVVSGDASNCGVELGCGATSDGLGLTTLGEVDSYRFPGLAGGQVQLRINDLDDRPGAYLIRAYDSAGRFVKEVCGDALVVPTSTSGTHTAVISACGDLRQSSYRLERFDSRCPIGPTITTMAFLGDDGEPVLPADFDTVGRPVYESRGRGLFVVEGRVGASLRGVGNSAFEIGRGPDFQAIVSRDLGAGDPSLCDQTSVPPGGIAATTPLTFRGDTEAVSRINDFGCRVDDGTGVRVGVRDPLNSCIKPNFEFGDPTTDIQFCAEVITAEPFPPGDTIVAARIRDLGGNFGAVRQIVVRVDRVDPPSPSPTPTPRMPTATHTPTLTRTPRPTNPPPATRSPGPCTCDCDFNGRVRIGEIVRSVKIALGELSLGDCRTADRDGDGEVGIPELIEGVRNALDGCPPMPIDVE